MAQIYDNINQKFVDGLRGIIGNIGVTRAVFCVGYFNLRGWKCISDLIEKLPGDYVYEEIDIDTLFAKHYGFTEEELEFIINYDIKYRMGSELEEE